MALQCLFSHPSCRGFKLDVTGSCLPSGLKGFKVGFETSKSGAFLINSNVDLLNGPIANAQVSTRLKDFLLGAEAVYDISSVKLDKYTASISLDRPREKVVLQMYSTPLILVIG